jgi:hypothetical protein
MATVSKESYLRLIENRPYKFDEKEVNYGVPDGEEVCRTCVHFFERVTDQFHTCEIFRPSDDAPVEPEYVCDFHTTDGEEFPFLTPKGKTSE